MRDFIDLILNLQMTKGDKNEKVMGYYSFCVYTT